MADQLDEARLYLTNAQSALVRGAQNATVASGVVHDAAWCRRAISMAEDELGEARLALMRARRVLK